MSKSRTQKAALNTITSGIAEVVQLVCSLILPRLIILNYGSAYNGITVSAKQFLTATSILIAGITASTRVALYKPLAENDTVKVSGIIKATERYMQKVGLVLFGLIAALVIFYPVVVDTGYSWIEVAPLILAAGISAAGRYIFGITYNALLAADQSIYISNILFSITNILNVVVSIVLIKLGFNIQAVKLISSLVLVLNPILRAVYARRKYRLIRNCEPDQSALAQRKDAMAHSVANFVHDNTDIVVLTLFCDIRIVSVYTVYNMVLNALKRTQQVFTSGTEAVFGNMWVKGEIDKIKINLGYFEYIMSAFATVVFSTTFVLLLPFISLYTKGVHDVEYLLPSYAFVITLAQIFYTFRTPYVTLVQGVGHYKQTRNGAIIEAIINMSLSVILVQFMGIVGVAIGTLAANIFRTIQYSTYIDKHLIKRGNKPFVGHVIWSFGNIAVICAISYTLADKFAYRSWGTWIGMAVIIVWLSIIITLISSMIFYRQEFKGVLEIGKRAFNTRIKLK